MPEIKKRSPTTEQILNSIVNELYNSGYNTLADYVDDLESFIWDIGYVSEYEHYKGVLFGCPIDRYVKDYFYEVIDQLEKNHWIPERIYDGIESNIAKDIKDEIEWLRQ